MLYPTTASWGNLLAGTLAAHESLTVCLFTAAAGWSVSVLSGARYPFCVDRAKRLKAWEATSSKMTINSTVRRLMVPGMCTSGELNPDDNRIIDGVAGWC